MKTNHQEINLTTQTTFDFHADDRNALITLKFRNKIPYKIWSCCVMNFSVFSTKKCSLCFGDGKRIITMNTKPFKSI